MVFFLDFPIAYCLRIWDLFIFYGYDILICAAVAAIQCFESRIAALAEFEDCMDYVNHLENHISQIPVDDYLKAVNNVWRRGRQYLKRQKEKYRRRIKNTADAGPALSKN